MQEDRGQDARLLELPPQGMQSAQSAYDVIALRVENNKGILVEQLDALATLIQAKANLALALYQDEIANAELLKATGRL